MIKTYPALIKMTSTYLLQMKKSLKMQWKTMIIMKIIQMLKINNMSLKVYLKIMKNKKKLPLSKREGENAKRKAKY